MLGFAAISLAVALLGVPSNAGLVAPSAQSVNLWRLRGGKQLATIGRRDTDFPVYTFKQPLDHFDHSTNATFNQRYWVSTRHYKPGTAAPVIVLDSGETSGEGRLSFMDTGIVDILARATGGLGVVLEHRYYGESIGTPDFSTDSLRWLTTKQSLEDSANFMRNVKFQGIDEDLTAPKTPWIYYGGSYAGARSALMKVAYPDIVYGAIASSGVVHADASDWEYLDVIRTYMDDICSANLVRSVEVIDAALDNSAQHDAIKALFNLTDLSLDQDFGSLLVGPLPDWQDIGWNSQDNNTGVDDFCAQLNVNTSTLADVNKNVTVGNLTVNIALPNYAKYIIKNVVSRCPAGQANECFGTVDAASYQVDDLSQNWRPWTFQTCIEWGFYLTAPPPNVPSVYLRNQDLQYGHKICELAFPPGKVFSVPPLPNTAVVNAYGGFSITADRLAFVDGERDPWRPDTAHSQYGANPPRRDTTLRPFKLIPGAVHHWDESGLADPSQEPPEIQVIHSEEVAFVQAWLKDFKKPQH